MDMNMAAAFISQNEAGFYIPPGQFVGLWQQTKYSDICIKLVAQSTEQGSDSQGSSSEGVVFKELPAHEMVLQQGSSYFKGLLTTGLEIAEQHAAKKRWIEITPSASEQERPMICIACDDEEDARVKEAVIAFLYNHMLPASPTVAMLCKMIIAADYLGADMCVRACAIGLSRLPFDQDNMLPVSGIMERFRYDLHPLLTRCLEAALQTCVLGSYGDVLSIIRDGDRLLNFCKLPRRAVEAWGQSSQLKVHSENTVVVLLINWWHNQPQKAQKDRCKSRLSDLVSIVFLSYSYVHDQLERLDWFVAPFSEYKHAWYVVRKRGIHTPLQHDHPYDEFRFQQRESSLIRQLTLTWRIPLEQIQQAFDSATGGYVIVGPQEYWQGYEWRPRLRVVQDNEHQKLIIQGLETIRYDQCGTGNQQQHSVRLVKQKQTQRHQARC